jgi:hypothetical protein
LKSESVPIQYWYVTERKNWIKCCLLIAVEFHTRKGFSSEVDIFITQTVLQYLCLKKHIVAAVGKPYPIPQHSFKTSVADPDHSDPKKTGSEKKPDPDPDLALCKILLQEIFA